MLLDEHFRVEGRPTWFEISEAMRSAPSAYLLVYNTKRSHNSRGVNRRTKLKAIEDGTPKTASKEVLTEPNLAT